MKNKKPEKRVNLNKEQIALNMKLKQRQVQTMDLAKLIYDHIAKEGKTVQQGTVVPQVVQAVVARKWSQLQEKLTVKELDINPTDAAAAKEYEELFKLVSEYDVAMVMDAFNQCLMNIQRSVEYSVADHKLSDYQTVFNLDVKKAKGKTKK